MSALLILRILLFAAEAAAVSLLLPVIAWVACRCFAGRAAMRHLIWLTLFVTLLLLPVLAMLVPAQWGLEYAMPAASAPVPSASASSWNSGAILALLFVAWAAGVAWNLLRLGVGAVVLRALLRGSAEFDAAPDVRLASSPPLTFGFFKPVILLPLDAPSWPAERLEAVLRHERAHVRRYDNLSQILALLACAFYWPNPLLWLGRTAMRRDAEIAADDLVLASGMKASAYAAELLELSEEYRHRAPVAALAMSSPSSLDSRVRAILSPTQSRNGVTRIDVLRILSLGAVALVLLALSRPGIAQVQAPLPSAAPKAAPVPPLIPEIPPAPPPLSATPVRDARLPPPPPVPPPAAIPVKEVPLPPPPAPLQAEHAIQHIEVLSKAEQADLRAAMEELKNEMNHSHREIARAVELRVNRVTARAIREQIPVIQAAVRRAMAKAEPAMREAMDSARIHEQVAAAMKKAEADLEASIARSGRDEP